MSIGTAYTSVVTALRYRLNLPGASGITCYDWSDLPSVGLSAVQTPCLLVGNQGRGGFTRELDTQSRGGYRNKGVTLDFTYLQGPRELDTLAGQYSAALEAMQLLEGAIDAIGPVIERFVLVKAEVGPGPTGRLRYLESGPFVGFPILFTGYEV